MEDKMYELGLPAVKSENNSEEIQPDDALEENTKNNSDNLSYIALDSTEEIQQDDALEENTKNVSDEQQDLELVSHDGDEIESLERRESFTRAIKLTAETLLGRIFQIYEPRHSCPSKGKIKAHVGVSGMEGSGPSENRAIPDKSITGIQVKTECLKESVPKGVCPYMELMKSKKSAEEETEVNTAKFLEFFESNSSISDSADDFSNEDASMREVNELLDAAVGVSKQERVEEHLYENFNKIVEIVGNDSIKADEECLQFLRNLGDFLEKNIRINPEKLLRINIIEFELMNKQMIHAAKELLHFIFRVSAFQSDEFTTKPSLKNKLHENVDSVYAMNSSLFQNIEIILERLRVIDNGIILKGSKEIRLKKVIAEMVQVIERMNKITVTIQEAIQNLNELFH